MLVQRALAREVSSNASGFECQSKQTEVVHFQTKITPLVQNKTTFIQVTLKSLYLTFCIIMTFV